MNFEKRLEETEESIRELTTAIIGYENEIETLRKAIIELECRVQIKDKSDTENLKFLWNCKIQRLSLAEQHLTGLRSSYHVLNESRNILIQLQLEGKFQNSSVHSSIHEGFKDTCRRDLQKELWQLFQVGFADPKYYFQSPRKLVDKDALDIVKKHYPKKVSEEIDIFLYANPTLPWKLHTVHNTLPNLYPFTKKIAETPNWSPAIESLNQHSPYSCPVIPPSSQNDLNQDVWEAQNNLRAIATMYMVFEATHSNKNLPVKLRQLEVQLAYVIIRFHLRISTEIPSENVGFKVFIAQEVLKLIAFAGVVLVEGESQKLLNQAHGAIYDKGNPYPALASLYKNGRLCYFNGATYPSRLSLLEAKVESLGSIKEKNIPRHFEKMQEFYDALRENDCDNEDIQIICDVFQKHRIKASILDRLTENDLKEYGLKQGGLRKAILAVIGK